VGIALHLACLAHRLRYWALGLCYFLFLGSDIVCAQTGAFFGGGMDLHALVLRLPGLLLGIGMHEWAHAWVSVKHGDMLPLHEGRVSLNPLDHLEPLGTLAILFGPIGWGKPVPINPSAYRNPWWDHVRVAIAGVMMNLFIAACATVIIVLIQFSLAFARGAWGSNLWMALQMIVQVNFGLAVFNLLPIPPLDGATVSRVWAPPWLYEIIVRMEAGQGGMILILILVYMRALNPIFVYAFAVMRFCQSGLIPALGFLFAMVIAWFFFIRSFPRQFSR